MNSFSPKFFDETPQISISKLKQWGYLAPSQVKHFEIVWDRFGSIAVTLDFVSEEPSIEISYYCNNKFVQDKIMLISKVSNLGKGDIWFFICPRSNKLCRKLYFYGNFFSHRILFVEGVYKSQILSRKKRKIEKKYGAYFQSEMLCKKFFKKHFKRHYKGSLTKKYAKLYKQIQQSENISIQEIEYLMITGKLP